MKIFVVLNKFVFFNAFEFFQNSFTISKIPFTKIIWGCNRETFGLITGKIFECDVESCYNKKILIRYGSGVFWKIQKIDMYSEKSRI